MLKPLISRIKKNALSSNYRHSRLGLRSVRKRVTLFVLAGLIGLSGLLSLFESNSSVYADSASCPSGVVITGINGAQDCSVDSSTFTPPQEIESLAFYVAMDGCLNNGMQPNIDSSTENTLVGPDSAPVGSGWFGNGSQNYIVYPNGGDTAGVSEDCGTLASQALTFWNFGSTQFLQTIGYKYVTDDDNGLNGWRSPSPDANGDVRAEGFESAMNATVYDGSLKGTYLQPSLDAPATYLLDLTMFEAPVCSAYDYGPYSSQSKTIQDQVGQVETSSVANVPTITSGNVAYIKDSVVQPDKTLEVDEFAFYTSSTAQAHPPEASVAGRTTLYGQANDGNTGNARGLSESPTCASLASTFSKDAVNYKNWLNSPANSSAVVVASPVQCKSGSTNPACTVPPTNSCAINGVGWIICPVITILGQLTDGMFQFLANNFLQTQVSTLATSGSTDGTYVAWGVMRNIANAAFVVVFLIIIFSQISNFGVNNYGIKKMLPRLIVAAILVNLSFFICQIAVDLSNILGFGLKGIFDNIGATVVRTAPTAATGADGTTGANEWESIVVIVLAASGGYAAYAALGTLIPLLIGALITILVIFLMLILRQMLIILIIVIAPIAFVAYLLPNTESLFKKWRQVLVSLLMLYPIIGLVFGASSLASVVLTQAYKGASTINGSSTGSGNVIDQIIAQAVLVIPLIIVPFLLKASLNGVGQLGAKINGFGSNVSNAGKKKTAEKYGESRLGQFQNYRKNEKANRRGMIRAGTYEGSNPFRKLNSTINKGLNNASGKFGTRLEASGVAAATKQQAEEVALAEKLVNAGVTKNGGGHAKVALEAALKSGDRVAAQAAQNILFTQGAAGMKDFYDTVNNGQEQGWANENAVSALRENINANHGLMVKTKASDASKWASKGGKLSDYTKNPNTWSGQSQTELSDQTGDSLIRAAGLKSDGKGGYEVAGPNLLDGAVAGQLLNNDQLKGKLNETQILALQHASGTRGSSGGTPPSSGTGGTPPPPGFSEQSNGFVVPRSRK